MREYVDLRVLPGDELPFIQMRSAWSIVVSRSVEVREHGSVASAVLAVPPRSRVRRPSCSARSTADSTAAASASRPRPWRSSIATDPNMASGLAIPCPAMSGAEPWTGSNTGRVRAGRRRGWRWAAGPSEPVITDASSLRMSPNMFSVTITSKWRGAVTSFIAA